jgi:tRNA(Ile2) C34 agmatinyltransferase TiaS
MKVFIGIDDTDTLDSEAGTGKLVRRLIDELPEGCVCRGAVRQQLLVAEGIPYTSHNSAACLVADVPRGDLVKCIIDRAIAHIARHAAVGSDPGLCVATDADGSLVNLIAFGHRCTAVVSTQQQAIAAVNGAHLSGHGGTHDGIIGAAAAVGLTASGWAGRFVEYGDLRQYPGAVPVARLQADGIAVVSVDRDALVPPVDDLVYTNGWLRPQMIGHRPVLLVAPDGNGGWQGLHRKRNKSGG